MATSIDEYLMAAEYILSEGNPNVLLCERGIRTFETSTRFTLDLSFIPVVRGLSHLPIIIDPSHGTGHWRYVEPMAMAAVAAGADGLIIEVHPDPAHASSDGPQSLKPVKFSALMERLRKLAPAVDRVAPVQKD
jgi:3-deoxy-7-phosphoheptulonate synthase